MNRWLWKTFVKPFRFVPKQKKKGETYHYIDYRLRKIILHQNLHATMFDFWYGEACKKELILDAIRDCVENETEGKLGHINKLSNDFIFKGITMRKYR